MRLIVFSIELRSSWCIRENRMENNISMEHTQRNTLSRNIVHTRMHIVHTL